MNRIRLLGSSLFSHSPFDKSAVLVMMLALGLSACGGGSSSSSGGGDSTTYWPVQFGTKASDIAYSVVVDSNDNVYVAGQTDGSLDGLYQGGRLIFN